MADTQTLIDKTTETQPGITAEGWLTDSWYLACPSKALKPGGLKHVIMLDQPIVVGRTEAGEAFALRDICPHRLVPLSAGKQVDTNGEPTVECPYHGWRFGTDGVCRHMPSVLEDQPYEPGRFRVRRYPVHEKNGMIFIFIPHDPKFDGEPDVPPPDFGQLPDKPKFVIEETFNAHMDDAVVGLMDPAHVAFVHSQWWWRPPSVGLKLKEKPFVPRDRGWAIDRHQPSSNSLAYKALFGGKVTTQIIFQLPGYRWEIVENDTARLLTLTCLTPVYKKQTRITQVTWFFGAPLLNLAIPIFKPAARKFLRQDGDIVDLQNEGMKYQKAMIWIDDIDVQAKWYRTLKKEWAASRTEGRPFDNPIKPVTLRWRS
ncbi:aromatic ring-hydroxylating dioxygenase subunit alpha [Henriciella barbarensis]|uniref:Aromatic ring-hydroxylating dioxygenase subunit alpha n=1 Tax=Henriciella barbarensis TaxID=86342 RepID=A0A399QZE5_9PROT|nr:aromatic ring-hydroxylating dioxygenase subunit alpha [Henriciella barbarensis]RIJ24260.1 aromatic ring-hydroxylating dioxygenase subunit alpha [Henriciella barbarensis]